jgi:hypothetical protein
MEEALQDPLLRLSFPALRYGDTKVIRHATAGIRSRSIDTFRISETLNSDRPNKALQEVLREFDRKVSGRKDELVARLAELLAGEYEDHREELDRFFGEHRFIRLRSRGSDTRPFPVLEEHALGRELLKLYCLQHLRGDVILEADHHNASVPVVDLAEAMLRKRVDLKDCFVAVL